MEDGAYVDDSFDDDDDIEVEHEEDLGSAASSKVAPHTSSSDHPPPEPPKGKGGEQMSPRRTHPGMSQPATPSSRVSPSASASSSKTTTASASKRDAPRTSSASVRRPGGATSAATRAALDTLKARSPKGSMHVVAGSKRHVAPTGAATAAGGSAGGKAATSAAAGERRGGGVAMLARRTRGGKSPLTGKARVDVSLDLNTDSSSDDDDDEAIDASVGASRGGAIPPPLPSGAPTSAPSLSLGGLDRSSDAAGGVSSSGPPPRSSPRVHHHAFVPTTHTSPRGGYTIIEDDDDAEDAGALRSEAVKSAAASETIAAAASLEAKGEEEHPGDEVATSKAEAPVVRRLLPAALDSYDGTGTRLSGAFERTLDTWHERDAAANDAARLRVQLDEQLGRNAELVARLETTQSAAEADRVAAAAREASLEAEAARAREAAGSEREAREALERQLAEERRRNSAYGRVASGRADVTCIPEEEAQELRREIQQQEELLRGYQKENEAATAALTRMKRAAEAVEEELRADVNRLNGEVARLRLEAERVATGGARHLERQLALEAKLAAVTREADAHSAELRQERDAARAACKAAEAKLAGVDMSAVERDAADVRLLDERLAEVRAAHGKEVAELKRRVAWFTENQELVSERDAHLKRQAGRIEELDRQLAAARRDLARLTPAAGAKEGKRAGGESAKKTRDSRNVSSAGVASLLGGASDAAPRGGKSGDVSSSAAFDAGLAKKPNSVAALIRAARPTHEESERIIALEAKVRRLTDELDGKDGEHERSLRTLQQTHLRFKAAMEKRLREAAAGAVGGPNGAPRVGASAASKYSAPTTRQLERKVHELQGEVDSLTEKLQRAEKTVKGLRGERDRERTAKLEMVRKSRSEGFGPEKENTTNGGNSAKSPAKSPARRPARRPTKSPAKSPARGALARAAATASDEVAAAAGGALPRNDGKEPLPPGHPAITPFDPAAAAAAAGSGRARDTSAPASPLAPSAAAACRVSWNAELERVPRERSPSRSPLRGGGAAPSPSASPARSAMRRRGATSASSAPSSPSRTPPHRSKTPPHRSRTPPSARRSLVSDVARAWEEEEERRPRGPRPNVSSSTPPPPPPPSTALVSVNDAEAQARSFASKLHALEARTVAREAYWQGVVREVQRAHAEDAAGLRRQCARAVEAKNVQIRQFRERLNGLIAAMHEQTLRSSIAAGAAQ